MKITKEIGIDMGHSVTLHESKCKHLHGHRYRIIATVDDKLIEEGSAKGMVIDFSDLKKAMMDTLDEPYDHAFVIWKEDPRKDLLQQAHDMWHNDYNKFHVVDFVPTAENLAREWFIQLQTTLRDDYKIRLYSLEVFETPTSSAIFTEENL
jgi:6-pyruvoyltetrahydropterin/6-carboxytetrahydropterin synthase